MKIWFGLVEPFKSYHGKHPKKKKKNSEGRSLLLGGELHLTCDAHFRTRMNYSSQKSCVRIWFGLVEIGGMLIFGGGGGRSPLLGGLHVTCDAHFRTWPSYSSQESCVKIWFGLVEPFKSYRGNIPHPPKKKTIRGLHLTYDTHFRTRMTYSSQSHV